MNIGDVGFGKLGIPIHAGVTVVRLGEGAGQEKRRVIA